MPNLDFDPSGILLGVPSTAGWSGIFFEVRSIPPTTGRSVSEIFPERFRLWTRSSPLTYCHTFTIFFKKLGIISILELISWTLLLEPNYCREMR